MASQSDFQAACDRLADHLGGDDPKAQAAAAVTVVIMLQSEASAPYAPSAHFGKLVKAFCELMESGEAAIQASLMSETRCQLTPSAIGLRLSLAIGRPVHHCCPAHLPE